MCFSMCPMCLCVHLKLLFSMNILIGLGFLFHREYVYLWNFQKTTYMKRLMYLIGFLILAVACKEVFEAPPQSFLVASFYDGATDKSVDLETMIQGVGAESILLRDTAVKAVLLPLIVKETNPLPVIDTTR